MGKKLKDLKKGDKIWFVNPDHNYWGVLTTVPPKIHEGTIEQDTSQQSSLPFPEYCYVHYYCPSINPNHLSSSEHGERDQGLNGHHFFTDFDECTDYVKQLAAKKLELAKEKIESLTRDVEELESILNSISK